MNYRTGLLSSGFAIQTATVPSSGTAKHKWRTLRAQIRIATCFTSIFTATPEPASAHHIKPAGPD